LIRQIEPEKTSSLRPQAHMLQTSTGCATHKDVHPAKRSRRFSQFSRRPPRNLSDLWL